jgi:hypothetical protein
MSMGDRKGVYRSKTRRMCLAWEFAIPVMRVPLENTIRSGDLRVLGGSGGVSVFVDQAAQDGSSVDPCGAGVGHGGAGDVTVAAGDVLCDALVGRAVL